MNVTPQHSIRLPGNTVLDLKKTCQAWLKPLRNLFLSLVALMLMILLYSAYLYYMSSWLAAD